VLVVTHSERVVRTCSPLYATYPYLVESLPYTREDIDFEIMLEKVSWVKCRSLTQWW
jgi:hypothetical protein